MLEPYNSVQHRDLSIKTRTHYSKLAYHLQFNYSPILKFVLGIQVSRQVARCGIYRNIATKKSFYMLGGVILVPKLSIR